MRYPTRGSVGLGTDNTNANDSTSMLEAMKLTALLHRGHDSDYPTWVGAEDAFRMATAGGASCAGLAGRTATWRPG